MEVHSLHINKYIYTWILFRLENWKTTGKCFRFHRKLADFNNPPRQDCTALGWRQSLPHSVREWRSCLGPGGYWQFHSREEAKGRVEQRAVSNGRFWFFNSELKHRKTWDGWNMLAVSFWVEQHVFRCKLAVCFWQGYCIKYEGSRV